MHADDRRLVLALLPDQADGLKAVYFWLLGEHAGDGPADESNDPTSVAPSKSRRSGLGVHDQPRREVTNDA